MEDCQEDCEEDCEEYCEEGCDLGGCVCWASLLAATGHPVEAGRVLPGAVTQHVEDTGVPGVGQQGGGLLLLGVVVVVGKMVEEVERVEMVEEGEVGEVVVVVEEVEEVEEVGREETSGSLRAALPEGALKSSFLT